MRYNERMNRICLVDGCLRTVQNTGMCNLHYQRKRVYGDPYHPGVLDRRTWEEKFLERVKIAGENECWPWTGNSFHKFGYGMCSDPRVKRRSIGAHRAAFLYWKGEITKGRHVLHSCDNPRCCNPSHLSLGSGADNVRDMQGKGRNTKRAYHPKAKLSEEDVSWIRKNYTRRGTGHVTIPFLAKKYSVSTGTIGAILRNKNWRE